MRFFTVSEKRPLAEQRVQIGALQPGRFGDGGLALLELDLGAERDVGGRLGRDRDLATLERCVRVGRVGQAQGAARWGDGGRRVLRLGLLERARPPRPSASRAAGGGRRRRRAGWGRRGRC